MLTSVISRLVPRLARESRVDMVNTSGHVDEVWEVLGGFSASKSQQSIRLDCCFESERSSFGIRHLFESQLSAVFCSWPSFTQGRFAGIPGFQNIVMHDA